MAEPDDVRRTPVREADMMDPWSWLWMLAWIVALLFMVWLVVRKPSDGASADEAKAILRGRFARGELSRSDYEQAIALLSDKREITR